MNTLSPSAAADDPGSNSDTHPTLNLTHATPLHAAYHHDFERWCEECVTITDKLTGLPVPFRLNAPQRRLAAVMERRRREGKPVRIILLKARQWGGSTLVQAYMAWHQLVRKKGRNALVCAHVKDAAASIRAVYTTLLDHYPDNFRTPDPAQWKLRPYSQTQSTLWLPARQARIAITSANNPEALRGASYHLAHLSEAAFWGGGDTRAASAIIRTVCGSVPDAPDTLIVIESTADGPDNWFAQEWQRAIDGESDMIPVFVPWHEIEIYRHPLNADQRRELLDTADEYERRLLDAGVKAEAVAWYRRKRREYATHAEMMAEFPSTPREAFATRTSSPFPASLLQQPCRQPVPPRAPYPSPPLLVAAIGRECALCEFVSHHGCIHLTAESAHPDLRSMMQAITQRMHEPSRPLLAIVEATPAGSHPHGSWCLRHAAAKGWPLCYNADSPLLQLSASPAATSLLGEMTDLHISHLAEERMFDTNAARLSLYSLFDPAAPWRSPLVMARMAASLLLESAINLSPLSPDDFLP